MPGQCANWLLKSRRFCHPRAAPLMKNSQTPESRSRFNAPVRHYHRTDVRPRRTWDDWVDGASAKPDAAKSRLKIIKIVGIVLALLALSGIIAGLIIEMR